MNEINKLLLDERLLGIKLTELLNEYNDTKKEVKPSILTMDEYLKQVDEYWKPETDPEK